MPPLRLLLLALVLVFATPAPGQEPARPSYPDTEAAQHVGEEATVTGKVVAISKSAKGNSFLNFGDRFPRQIFTGVVFARDEAAVGDLQKFEGQQVALTGKIELSPEQKPQIVIRKADQLRIIPAAPEPGAPAPPPTQAPSPASPPAK